MSAATHSQMAVAVLPDPGLVRVAQLRQLALGALHSDDDFLGWQREEAVRAVRLVGGLAEAHAELRDARCALRTAAAARSRTYYKVVAKVSTKASCRYLSVYDGITEYKLGERTTRQRTTQSGSAFFVYPSVHAAAAAPVPTARSRLRGAPLVVLRVRGEGSCVPACGAHGVRLLTWSLTPLKEVARVGPAMAAAVTTTWEA